MLGVQDCPSPQQTWGWNLAGKVVVTDDATKWKVKQFYTSSKFTYKYRDGSGNLQTEVLDFCPSSNPCPHSDGPEDYFIHQKSGQRTIFWLDGPNVLRVQGKNLDQVVDSGLLRDTFYVQVCSKADSSNCATKSWYVQVTIDPNKQMNRNAPASNAGLQ